MQEHYIIDMNLKGVDFSEEQSLHLGIRIICLVSAIVILIGAYISFMQVPSQPKGESWAMFIGVTLTFLVLTYVFLFKLETSINTSGIKVKCWPINKEFKWSQISTMEVINYGFIGGWGIRVWTKYDTVYNAQGKIGLSIKLKSGKQFVIGTQKKSEMNKIVERWKNIS